MFGSMEGGRKLSNLAELETELDALLDLEEDWNGEAADAISPDCVSCAKAFLPFIPANLLESTCVFPKINAVCSFAWVNDKYRLSIDFNPKGDTDVRFRYRTQAALRFRGTGYSNGLIKAVIEAYLEAKEVSGE